MARKKSDSPPAQAKRPTLQISGITPEFKADVDDLALACGKTTSEFLKPLIEKIVADNQEKISLFRQMRDIPLYKSKRRSKPKTPAQNSTTADKNGADKAGETQ